MGDGVPAYLRFEEKVRNRRLGKRDCLLTIKDLWNERYTYSEQLYVGVLRLYSKYIL